MQSGKSRCEAVAKATGCVGLRLPALAASCVFGLQGGYRTDTSQSSVSNPYGEEQFTDVKRVMALFCALRHISSHTGVHCRYGFLFNGIEYWVLGIGYEN